MNAYMQEPAMNLEPDAWKKAMPKHTDPKVSCAAYVSLCVSTPLPGCSWLLRSKNSTDLDKHLGLVCVCARARPWMEGMLKTTAKASHAGDSVSVVFYPWSSRMFAHASACGHARVCMCVCVYVSGGWSSQDTEPNNVCEWARFFVWEDLFTYHHTCGCICRCSYMPVCT